MARRLPLVLLATAVALLAGCAGRPALAPADYRPVAGHDPRALAAAYLQRRDGRAPVLAGAGDIALCQDPGQAEYAEATARLLEALPDALVFAAGDNVYQDGTWAEFIDCYDKTWGSKCILGIWHHPRFTSARRGDNAPTAALWDRLSAADADLVVSGRQAPCAPAPRPPPGP